MKATYLLKRNIESLLSARGQTQHDLAQWCRRSDAWLSKILSESDANQQKRGVPLKYLDRIADFFGLATYQLFQPGISPLTERRKGLDRRTGRDRRAHAALPGRIQTADLPLTAEDVALLLKWKSLNKQARADIVATIEDLLGARTRRRAAGTAPAAPASSAATTPAPATRRAQPG